jgi:4-carboxymuconolactone decarboxylase
MKVIKVAQVTTAPAGGTLFTGPVTLQPVVTDQESKHFNISQVNFGRGIRNKLHTHSVEQVLIVTEGKGIIATEKEEISIVPGDIVIIPAGEKHWHGAAKGSTFSHLHVIGLGNKTVQLED